MGHMGYLTPRGGMLGRDVHRSGPGLGTRHRGWPSPWGGLQLSSLFPKDVPQVDSILGPCGHAAEAFLGVPPSHVRKSSSDHGSADKGHLSFCWTRVQCSRRANSDSLCWGGSILGWFPVGCRSSSPHIFINQVGFAHTRSRSCHLSKYSERSTVRTVQKSIKARLSLWEKV